MFILPQIICNFLGHKFEIYLFKFQSLLIKNNYRQSDGLFFRSLLYVMRYLHYNYIKYRNLLIFPTQLFISFFSLNYIKLYFLLLKNYLSKIIFLKKKIIISFSKVSIILTIQKVNVSKPVTFSEPLPSCILVMALTILDEKKSQKYFKSIHNIAHFTVVLRV